MAKTAKIEKESDERGSRKRATSYDVAELAGVSQSAVSRVFQPGASASKDMRDRVISAANKLGYRPNAIARGLITQRSNMVAVVISRQTNLYYPEVLVQLTQRFSEDGIRVLLFTLEHEADIDGVLEQVLQYQVDGVVTAAMLNTEQLKTIENAGIPVIFYNRTLPDRLVNSVRCDQEEGERWLVGQLAAAGHKRFAIVSGPEDSSVGMERTQGALQKLRDLDIVGGDDCVREPVHAAYNFGKRGAAARVAKVAGDNQNVIDA
ncbi:MAG: LacI family DNA-binding transcriptional regulator, partial [Pseudomonadota bacterium]